MCKPSSITKQEALIVTHTLDAFWRLLGPASERWDIYTARQPRRRSVQGSCTTADYAKGEDWRINDWVTERDKGNAPAGC